MKKIFAKLLFLPILILISCDSSNDSFDPSVINTSLDENQLVVGDSTILKIGLDYDRNGNRIFDRPDDVSLVVKLPAGVRFRTGTAEIQGVSDDEVVRPVVTNCDVSGEQFLDFDIDGDDLVSARDPSGAAEAEIRLTIDAASQTQGIVFISAQADNNNVLYACGSAFASQSDSSIQVQ